MPLSKRTVAVVKKFSRPLEVLEGTKPYIRTSMPQLKAYKYGRKQGAFYTFTIPEVVFPSDDYKSLGRELIQAFRTDGLLQVAIDAEMEEISDLALLENRKFCNKPFVEKSKHLTPYSYSGYVGSGEEETGGTHDASEIFTVTPDIALEDSRVKEGWPCHGAAPWPNATYRDAMKNFMNNVTGKMGENLAKLIALGLGLEIEALTKYTKDGWHHMRVLHFPALGNTKIPRGIRSHTDYGLLVLAYQDEVGGLFIRPPVEGEVRLNNWLDGHSMAAMYDNETPWTFVEPVPKVLTVFPGDMLQLITNGYLASTPHKVSLNTKDRYALAYFHEPSFGSVIETRKEFSEVEKHSVFYGEHFTNMFMRCYPNRITTQHINGTDYVAKLKEIKESQAKKIKEQATVELQSSRQSPSKSDLFSLNGIKRSFSTSIARQTTDVVKFEKMQSHSLFKKNKETKRNLSSSHTVEENTSSYVNLTRNTNFKKLGFFTKVLPKAGAVAVGVTAAAFVSKTY